MSLFHASLPLGFCKIRFRLKNFAINLDIYREFLISTTRIVKIGYEKKTFYIQKYIIYIDTVLLGVLYNINDYRTPVELNIEDQECSNLFQ